MTAPELEAQSLVDPFLLVHLDEDWAVPCMHIKHAGDNPAAWIAWSAQCCPKMRPYRLWCTPCLDGSLQRMAAYARNCPHCGHLFAPAVTVIRLIEPLNRRTT